MSQARTDQDSPIDLRATELYLNRELTWLRFNHRVLHEAQDERNPLLERVKFLAISDSNLDEFVMKRIGGLKRQRGAGVHKLTVDGRTPAQQIAESYEAVQLLLAQQAATLDALIEELADAGVHLATWDELGPADRAALRAHYIANVYPLVTPQSVDPAHPFPFVSNLSLNLLCNARRAADGAQILVRIKVPVGKGIPRFLAALSGALVPLEVVMAENLDILLPGMEIADCDVFRVTRNANTETEEEEADDLLAMIEGELRDRRFAPIVRLEVDPSMNADRRAALAHELDITGEAHLFEVPRLLGLADLWEIVGLDLPELRDPTHHPVDPPALVGAPRVIDALRDGPVLLSHPYDSFTSSVERFVHEAARDPKVLAIKVTLYRTSESTEIVDDLIEAAKRGKQVAVVVELKARFDEEANIRWAARLENVGIHVTYGVVGLKTHCKIILVIRRDHDGLRRYAHIGTGNYHAGTARLYTDLGLLTTDPDIGRDLTELFNYLTTGLAPERHYRRILVAPRRLKSALIDKIHREIEHHTAGRPARIRFKMNALEDADVTHALYRASQAGVPVDLIVRDTCRLRPGLPGISETARVISLVGRFLEHARIYTFANGGVHEVYLGSADCMTRNLVSRVEVLTPLDAPELQRRVLDMLELQLADRRNAWEMQPDGSYVQLHGDDRGAQAILVERADAAYRAAVRRVLGDAAFDEPL